MFYKDDLAISEELMENEGKVNAIIELWCDVEKKLGIILDDEEWVNFYADYDYKRDKLKTWYERSEDYIPTIYYPNDIEKQIIIDLIKEHKDYNEVVKLIEGQA